MIRPRAGSRFPAINRSSVDLTEPFGPTTATRSAGLTENETLSNRTGPDRYSNESSDRASKDITPPGRPLHRRLLMRVGLYRFIDGAGRRRSQSNTGRTRWLDFRCRAENRGRDAPLVSEAHAIGRAVAVS